MQTIEELDERYGAPGVDSTPWDVAEQLLREAPLSWLASLRPGAGPHVTPLVTAWADGAVHFTTGPDERKGRNLRQDPHCTMTTGRNDLHGGIDVVVEGTAVRVTDPAGLQTVQQAFLDKYGEEWHFEIEGDAFRHGPARPWVFRLEPTVAYAFAKDPYSHTRYRF